MDNEGGSTHEPAPSPDRDTTVDHDLPCTRCGYNLRTLSLDARCPECGQLVDISLAEHAALKLHSKSPAYLRRLAWGLILCIAATLPLALAAGAWEDPALIAVALLSGPGGAKVSVMAIGVSVHRWVPVAQVLGGLSVALHAIGVFLVTAHDPARWNQRAHRRAIACRISAVVMAALFALTFVKPLWRPSFSDLRALTPLVIFALDLIQCGLFFGWVRELARDAGRFEDASALEFPHIYAWLLLAVTLTTLGCAAVRLDYAFMPGVSLVLLGMLIPIASFVATWIFIALAFTSLQIAQRRG